MNRIAGNIMATEIKYEIIEEIGLISENAKGWRKELNFIRWNSAAPKYDIRIGHLTVKRWERALHLLQKRHRNYAGFC